MRPVGARLHGSGRDGELFSYLGVAETGVVLQAHGFPVLSGQGIEGTADFPHIRDLIDGWRWADKRRVRGVEAVVGLVAPMPGRRLLRPGFLLRVSTACPR